MTDLVDIERPLALFAEGIAGHYCHLKIGDGEVADRNSVFLPESIDLFEEDDWNAGAYRLKVLLQLGFQEFGTFDFDIARARILIPDLGVRERPESHRESDLTVFFNHFDAPSLARRLFHLLEHARIEARALAKYPGARKYRDALAPHTPPLPDFLHDVAQGLRAPNATVYTTAASVVACYEALAPEAQPFPSREFPGQMEWLQREARLEDWEEDLDQARAQVAAFELAEESGEVQVGDGDGGDGDIRDIGRDLASCSAASTWNALPSASGTSCSAASTWNALPCDIASAMSTRPPAVSATTSGTICTTATSAAGAGCSRRRWLRTTTPRAGS